MVMRLPGFLPRVCLLVIGDGRGLRDATLASFEDNALDYVRSAFLEVDDSHHVLGFCGAIRYAWEMLRQDPREFDYVFHLEEDWRFERSFNVAHMARLLDTEPSVAQVALRRGAEPGEAAVVDAFPREFEDRTTGMISAGQTTSQEWLEHRLFFTTNPSLYRRSLLEFDWPRVPGSEGAFTQQLIDARHTFAYWGERHDEPWITHTGTRAGHGY
jgi:hypothetical protein